MSLLNGLQNLETKEFHSEWISPSNIAFIKYWGKKGHQIPANPSFSMTLSQCVTKTSVKFTPSENLFVDLKLDGVSMPSFGAKIETYLISIADELPWIKNLNISVETSNTFPHGTGIASSASGMSAFALNLMSYISFLSSESKDDLFYKRASYLARLASGSACRSIFGGFSSWGEYGPSDASDKYASPLIPHADLSFLHDSILVVSSQEKKTSSTSGHKKMDEHYFAQARYRQARDHFDRGIAALKTGDMEEVGSLLEKEALSLHGMMMTTPDYYMLMRPNTLKIIELIWDFRSSTKIPLYFTLDAGPNLHLIYPDYYKNKVQTFITHELSNFCEQIIHDFTGKGPSQCL